MRPTFLTTAFLVAVAAVLPATPAKADHICTPAIARNARLLERVTCDLHEHIHEEYLQHPWSSQLCETADSLHFAAKQFNASLANHTPVDFLADDLAQVCQTHQQLARLLRATGVPACVQADLNRAGSLISRLEQQVNPIRIQPFPGVGGPIRTPRVPVIVPPVSRIPGRRFPTSPYSGEVFPQQPGPVFPGEAVPFDPRFGNGVHVPAPSARNNVPSPTLYLGQGANGRPEVGLQMGNVRLSFGR